MKWQTVVGLATNHTEIPQPFPLPVREDVPMEEREARASRFVSLLVGDTDKLVPSKPSNVVPLLPLRVARLHRKLEEAFLPGALDPQPHHREAEVGYSVPQRSREPHPK